MPGFIRLRSFLFFLFLVQGAFCTIGFGQANAPNQSAAKAELAALPEMWAKLHARIELEKLTVGDKVDAVIGQGWVYRTCGVNGGEHLTGEVVALRAWSDSNQSTEAAIAFTAVCQNKDKVSLILVALYRPTNDGESNMEMVNSLPQGIGQGAYGRNSGMAQTVSNMPSPGAGDESFPLAKFGEVNGLHHVSIAVAKGPHGTTVISTPEKKFKLEVRTRLALVPVPQSQ